MSLRSKKRIVIALLAAAFVLALVPTFAWGAARLLIVSTPPQRADAIVMMSGSATFRERARHAAELFKEGRAGRIILTNDNLPSGWSESQGRNPFYYERARDELRQLGVPEQSIEVIRDPILGTYHEACVIKLYCQDHNLNSIVIVTSGYHSRRALWTFRQVLKDTEIQVGMDPVAPGIDTPAPATWWLKSFGWKLVTGEYGKLLCYRLNIK